MENDATADARAANYKQWAELLLAQPNARRLAGESITLQSWTDETLTIPLDPRLTLVENAEKYYAKTRAAAESAKVRAQRLPVYKNVSHLPRKFWRNSQSPQRLAILKRSNNLFKHLSVNL